MNSHFLFREAIAHVILSDGSRMDCWAPKYLSYALALDFKGQDLEALQETWEHYLKYAAKDDIDQWFHNDDLNSCVKSILSSGKSLNDFLSPSHLTAHHLAPYFVWWEFAFHSIRHIIIRIV